MGVILPLGKALVKTITLFRGKRYRSQFVKSVAFAGYNSKFPKSEGKNAWLTRDLDKVSDRDGDKRTSFTFTLAAYYDLFCAVGLSNSKKWFDSYQQELPTLIMSGAMDPVGSWGEGPKYVYKRLLVRGVADLKLKLYEGARHELFNEQNRSEVFADITAWLDGIFK